MGSRRQDEVLDSMPPAGPSLLPQIVERVRQSGMTVVAVDDDPTGNQTVHDVPVLLDWSVERLANELAASPAALFILTNSRSGSEAKAQAQNREIGRNLLQASHQTGRSFVVISRSDSTLRGHFPAEMNALAECLDIPFDGWLLIPAFFEGGRLTIDDTHYIADGEWLTSVGETEFAHDPVFGYRSSHLAAWVEEKSNGRIPQNTVHSISINTIREGGPSAVAEHLSRLTNGAVCVVNAASPVDLEVFTLGLLEAEAQGKRFLYRTAASFVQVRAGIRPRPLLEPEELRLKTGSGLIIAGSHVQRTTEQLAPLLNKPGTTAIELNIDQLLDENSFSPFVDDVAGLAETSLTKSKNVLLFTSRMLRTGSNASENLKIGRRIASGITEIVSRIRVRPRYIIAKGGITAHVVARDGLNVRRAWVLGQILPGIPVWQLGEESRFPECPYVVFPGNVGDSQALLNLVDNLEKRH